MKTSQMAMLVGGVGVALLAAWFVSAGVDTGPDVADRALPEVRIPAAPVGEAPSMSAPRPGTAAQGGAQAGQDGQRPAAAVGGGLIPAPGDPLAELAYGQGMGDNPPDEVIRRTAMRAMDMHVDRTRKQVEAAMEAIEKAPSGSKEAFTTLSETMADIEGVQAQLRDGQITPDEAFQQVNDLRRQAGDRVAERGDESAAKLIRHEMGFGDEGGWEGIGWGVPLDEEGFGQLFEEP